MVQKKIWRKIFEKGERESRMRKREVRKKERNSEICEQLLEVTFRHLGDSHGRKVKDLES